MNVLAQPFTLTNIQFPRRYLLPLLADCREHRCDKASPIDDDVGSIADFVPNALVYSREEQIAGIDFFHVSSVRLESTRFIFNTSRKL
jgi:hypothetical protein